MKTDVITVYGAAWCGDTRLTRAHLGELGISYQYVDVDADTSAQEWVLRQNDGKQKLPTVDVGGLVLSIPSDGELDTALRRQGFLRHSNEIDALGSDQPGGIA